MAAPYALVADIFAPKAIAPLTAVLSHMKQLDLDAPKSPRRVTETR